jgi:hypothetical protein
MIIRNRFMRVLFSFRKTDPECQHLPVTRRLSQVKLPRLLVLLKLSSSDQEAVLFWRGVWSSRHRPFAPQRYQARLLHSPSFLKFTHSLDVDSAPQTTRLARRKTNLERLIVVRLADSIDPPKA